MDDQQGLIPPEWLNESSQEIIDRAVELLKSNEVREVWQARKLCEVVLSIDRHNPGIIFLIASSYLRQSRWAYAEHWFRRALAEITEETPPKAQAPMHCNLGYCLQQEGRNEEAAACFQKAVDLDPVQSEYLNNLATLFVNNGTPEEAVRRCALALDVDPDNEDAKWNQGLAYLELGQWDKGWAGYKSGLVADVQSSQKRKQRTYPQFPELPYWDGTRGQKVVLYGEQGVGDEILAVSMLEDAAKENDLIYEAHPRLVNIMRHNFGNQFPIYGSRKIPQDEVQWPNWEKPDAKLAILGLGEHYRRKDEDFPGKVYLKPFDSLVDKYKEKMRKMGSRPKIGISWKGGSVLTRHDLRSIPIGLMQDMFKTIDADWISLQYDNADRPGWNTPIVEGFEKDMGVCLNHDTAVINDLDECYGGLIHALDLVISVNTSLVHACGAFGVPCWVLTPKRPAWRYNIEGERMIWYGGHVRQIRQTEDSWEPVIKEVTTQLQGWLEEVTAA